MKITAIEPPRVFSVGVRESIQLKDCGRVALEPDEQVTFITGSGTEYDVVRKTWGYYATPSLNSRLPSFGLKPALTRSGDRLYLLLVEETKKAEFFAYLQQQGMEVVSWLADSPCVLRPTASACLFCGSHEHTLVFTYEAPPAGETVFPLREGEVYHREIWRCQGCGHFVNRHQLDLGRLYEGGYVDATYSGDKLLATFQKIMALPSARSDNYHRVQRLLSYLREWWAGEGRRPLSSPTVLDIGSGLGVFPQRMKDAGWACTALDPDPRAVRHAQDHIGVQGICGDFLTTPQVGVYDLLTFNKVLEHVEDPAALLRKSRQHVHPNGVVYVELPDGEDAAADSAGREEFFIEHFHMFSLTSLSLLATQTGFVVRGSERVREPSGKYTLRAFLHPKIAEIAKPATSN